MSPSDRGAALPLRHILVDIDARAKRHPALEQAVDLAKRCGARVTIGSVVEDVPGTARAYLTARLEADLLGERQEALAAIAAKYARHAVKVSTTLLRGRPATALVKAVRTAGVDLLVRWHARDVRAGRAGFGSVDMQLLRKCPCPVWVVGVGVGERTRPKRILAAVHPDRDDAVEQALNKRIVEAARVITELENGALTILTAWAPYGETLLRSHMTPAELRQSVRAARETARVDFEAVLAEVGPLDRKTTVEFIKGQASEVIPRYAKSHDIDLVVMGTVARRGLVGLLMGNTAEEMIQRLRCSVFALKPAGFKAPDEA